MAEGRFAPAVDEDEDTAPGVCPGCVARAQVDATLVRAGVVRSTVVTDYERPRVGVAPRERSKALLCLPGEVIVKGEGESREDAIADALQKAGTT